MEQNDYLDAHKRNIETHGTDAVSVVVTKTDKPNSIQFRLAGVGSDVKIYFNDAAELKASVEALTTSDVAMAIKLLRDNYREQSGDTGGK